MILFRFCWSAFNYWWVPVILFTLSDLNPLFILLTQRFHEDFVKVGHINDIKTSMKLKKGRLVIQWRHKYWHPIRGVSVCVDAAVGADHSVY